MGEEQPESLNTEDDLAQSKQTILYYVDFSQEFDYYYNNVFTPEKLDLIDDFIDHYELNGLSGWKGKISNSWNVPETYANWKERSAFAKEHKLSHVHIGLPYWQNQPNIPYLTSNQVLHFQKVSNYEIKLLTVSTHNPMDLPTLENILDE